MKLGFTFDEKCLSKISEEELIYKAAENNVSSIEVSPDIDVLPVNQYKKIIKLAASNSFEVNYHIPYFANNIYDTDFFISRNREVKNKYEEFFSLIESFQEFINNAPIIVMHGAKYSNETDKEKALHSTQSFIDWMLNVFEARNLNYRLGIETLRIKDERSIGDERSDILYIVDSFKSEKLGVCWDMCHDSSNYFPDSSPFDKNLFEKTIYCHIHGANLAKKISHVPLTSSDIEFTSQINNLTKGQYSGVINIELLVNYCEDTYIEELFKDINYMNKLTKSV